MLTIKLWVVALVALWVGLVVGLVADLTWLVVVVTAGFALLVVERAVGLRRGRASKEELR